MGSIGRDWPIWGAYEASVAIRSWTSLLHLTNPEVVPAHFVLFQQGLSPDSIFLIERGLVTLNHLTSAGDDVAVGLRFAGQLAEYSAVILRHVYDVSAWTASDTTFYRVPIERFLAGIRRQPDGVALFESTAAIDMLQLTTRLISSRTDSAERRLERLLQELAAHDHERIDGAVGVETRVYVPFSNTELAALISVTPEHFSRLKHKLAKQGRFRQTGQTISVWNSFSLGQ